ncbi:MAG: hypothetical protein GX880_09755, partial [Methanomicrobiales archaeon]|nr:hypothetical protein [Methanomicrobiales archaeon]
PAAMAASVTITPTTIESGDTVTVNVKDLSENATFSLGISAEFDVTEGDVFSFSARDLTLPFALDQGKVSAYTKGTAWTELAANLPDGGSVSLNYTANADGECRISQPRNLPSGTLNAVTLSGKAVAGNIITQVEISGTKRGPDDGTISFAIEGLESGTATVAVYIDGQEALSQKIAIGTEPAPVETETPSTGGNGGSSSGSSSSSPSTTPPAPTTTTSADGRVSLTGADIGGASLLSLAVEGTLPPGWTTAGRAYAVTPADRALDAVLSFPAPDAVATIARLENGTWVIIPSVIDGDRITAGITEGGSYAVLVPAGVPTQTVIPATTTAPPAATTTPAATPLPALLPALACAILILVQSRRG